MITKSILHPYSFENPPVGETIIAHYRLGVNQIVGVVAMNCSHKQIILPSHVRVKWWYSERYLALDACRRQEIRTRLLSDNWDFVKHPNPPVFYGIILPLICPN